MKRVYAETVKKWAKGIGISGVTLIGLIFMYLVAVGAISNVSYSGDVVCAGTELDPCYAYINFTAEEDIFIYPTNYDPWGRDTLFNFDPNVKSWRLERSWGKGWRNIPLNKSCTGTWCGLSNSKDERKFSIAFREGRDYQIRIVAMKNSPYEKIKWGAFSGVDEIDPIWLSPYESNYTKGSETHCKDGICNKIIYSGIRFVEEDTRWKKVENAKSLKNKGFDIIVESDGVHNIEVLDFNYSFIEFDLSFDMENIGEYEYEVEDGKMKTKYKVVNILYNKTTGKSYSSEVEYEVEIEEGESQVVKYFGNPFEREFHFGENSTTIQLVEPDTENLKDACSIGSVVTCSADDRLYVSFYPFDYKWASSILAFNISSLPENITILESLFSGYIEINGLAAGETIDWSFYYVRPFPLFNISGVEWNDTNWNLDALPSSSSEYNISAHLTRTIYWNDENKFLNFNVTSLLKESYDNSDEDVTIWINMTSSSATEGGESIWFYSKEKGTASLRPYLNITYEGVVEDTCTYTSGNWEIDCNDNCTISSDVNVGGNNIIFTNPGTFWLKADIINYGSLSLSSGCNIVFDDTKQLISS